MTTFKTLKTLRLVAVVILACLNFGFSYCSRTTSKSVCNDLQSKGFVSGCQEGTPWTFEVTRHEAQWMFVPTSSEIFKCYKVTDGFTHVPCIFKGAITQFASVEDMDSAIKQIQVTNHHTNKTEDLAANVTRADTTLEQYIMYRYNRLGLLIIMPVTEDAGKIETTLETLYGPSDS